jgi:hypothetical protein
MLQALKWGNKKYMSMKHFESYEFESGDMVG